MYYPSHCQVNKNGNDGSDNLSKPDKDLGIHILRKPRTVAHEFVKFMEGWRVRMKLLLGFAVRTVKSLV